MLAVGLDLQEASLVFHSCAACIVEPGVEDLVVCRGKTLEIYRIAACRMSLYCMVHLAATVKGMDRIRTCGVDNLLLLFDKCKVST